MTLEVTAENPNGTTVSNISLPTPQANSVTLSASPTSTTAGQAVTLSWSLTAASTSSAGTTSASISGVGPLELDDSQYPNYHGTVTVYPTETTTYTISSWNDCAEATASATVEVTPRSSRATARGRFSLSDRGRHADPDRTVWFLAQHPSGAAHANRDGGGVRYQILEDVRTPTRVVSAIRFAIREDVRTPTRRGASDPLHDP